MTNFHNGLKFNPSVPFSPDVSDLFRISIITLMFIALTSCQRESADPLLTGEERKKTTTLEHIEMLSGEVTFTLEDGEALNNTYPDTFWIPAREIRENLVKDDIVKLIFNLSDGKKTQGERMWVIVPRAATAQDTKVFWIAILIARIRLRPVLKFRSSLGTL